MPLSTWKTKQIIYGQALLEIEELFKCRKLTFMPIKGAYLIMSGLAVSIPNRRIRDIDLLIPEEKFDETCDWFSALSNVSEHPNYWNFERSFLYNMENISVYCEFHRLINFPARFLLPNKTLFSHAVSKSASTFFPDPVDALLIHICHMLPHVVDGYSEQTFQEISILTSQSGFSWDKFWIRAETTGIISFIWLVIHKCNRFLFTSFPLPTPPSLYAALLGKFNLFMACKWPLGRRIFFEIPFVRDIIMLLRN